MARARAEGAVCLCVALLESLISHVISNGIRLPCVVKLKPGGLSKSGTHWNKWRTTPQSFLEQRKCYQGVVGLSHDRQRFASRMTACGLGNYTLVLWLRLG